MTLRALPNLITVLRILLVGPLVLFLLDGSFGPAFALFLLAGISDVVDGFLARRYGWFSRFGAVADPIADKLLMFSTYVTLALVDYLPWWVAVAVVARDVVIVAGALVYRLLFGELEMEPTGISKFNTFMQVALVVTVLASAAFSLQLEPLREGLMAAVLASTVLSGATYVWIWGRRAQRGFERR